MGSKRKRAAAALAALLIFFTATLPVWAAPKNQENESQVIRVGYPIQAGLTDYGANGQRVGYSYEYLMEIAQYTGWEYEFVELDGDIDDVLTQMLDMLKNGELDLMSAMTYNDSLAEIYDYPGYSYGTAYTVFCVPESDSVLNEINYQSLERIRIAVDRAPGPKSQAGLKQFSDSNGLDYELVICGSLDNALEEIKAERADVLMCSDLSMPKSMRAIAKFLPQPYYFATTNGRTDIISKLNFAIMKINETDPYFGATLYDKYFAKKTMQLILSEEEKNYIKNSDIIKVAAAPEKAPVQYFSEGGELKGISKDILDYISRQTGLRFETQFVRTQKEYNELLESGEADVAIGVPYDQETAALHGIALTTPYIKSQVSMAVNKKIDLTDLSGKRLALPEGYFHDEEIPGPVKQYDSLEACLEAVNSGAADYCYGNGYSIQYYFNQKRYSNVSLISQSGGSQGLCIGVSKPADPELLTILNKVVKTIPEQEIQSIIYANTLKPQENITLSSYIDANPKQSLFIVVGALTLLFLLLAIYLRTRMKSQLQAAVEYERNQRIVEMSNEYFFQYDYLTDTLTRSERNAKRFGGELTEKNYHAKVRKHLEEGTAPEHERILAEQIFQGGELSCELECPMRDGSKRWLRITSKTICNPAGKPVYTVGKIGDIQEEMEERQRLVEKSQMDGLTGVLNASSSWQKVHEALEQGPGALLIIDVDDFKDVNDHYGHFTGDCVLRELAGLLRKIFREGDVIGRIGGDEFIVFMKGTLERSTVEDRCRRLLDAMSKDMYGCGVESDSAVTLSVGAALAEARLDYEKVYQSADRALYRVKHKGRNGYEIVDCTGLEE